MLKRLEKNILPKVKSYEFSTKKSIKGERFFRKEF